MNRYISLLRGINIAGQKKILMKDLKDMYESLGFSDVVTYIQSGNVLFTSPEKNTDILSKKVHSQIQKTFGFDVPILTITRDFLQDVISHNPFGENKFYITYLFDIPREIPSEKIEEKKTDSEQMHIHGSVIYFYCPDGYYGTKLSNNFFEKVFQTTATTRNLNTTKKLLELSK